MGISAQQVQKLRQTTGAGIMDVKQALEEADGDMQKAHDILRAKGVVKAVKKGDREMHEGRIEAYIHGNAKIGVLLKMYCETDFVARNEQFVALSHDIALHIAALSPQYISPQDIPQDVIESEKRIYLEQLEGEDKPESARRQFIEGKLKKFAQEASLLTQPFVKDPDKTVEDVIQEHIAKLGENIQVGAFERYEL